MADNFNALLYRYIHSYTRMCMYVSEREIDLSMTNNACKERNVTDLTRLFLFAWYHATHWIYFVAHLSCPRPGLKKIIKLGQSKFTVSLEGFDLCHDLNDLQIKHIGQQLTTRKEKSACSLPAHSQKNYTW